MASPSFFLLLVGLVKAPVNVGHQEDSQEHDASDAEEDKSESQACLKFRLMLLRVSSH